MNTASKLSEILNIEIGDKIAVVGCNGKTSVIEILAFENINKKVLISPTTKIFFMAQKDIIVCTTEESCRMHYPVKGVQCFGILQKAVEVGASQKLSALPLTLLESLAKSYDIVLMEADGSGGLPFKGYKDYEPVIPSFSSRSIAVINLQALYQPATKLCVHNLPEFLLQTGLQENDIIDEYAIVAMVCGKSSMLKSEFLRNKHSTLLMNGAVDEQHFSAAKQIANIIRMQYLAIDTFVVGCTRNRTWRKI
ncbi:MAG: selenium cofactor biosynthesis protein YqeC [Defluviitaleaceae bacterium]|nr:selenium cofactor biosynthesis protein YqeC [Defluviitaleaceae bacterium]